MEETISWSEANNMESKLGSNIQTEVFPVKVDKLPRLYAYRLDAKGETVSSIGGKIAYRLRKKFSGHWVWTKGVVVSDTLVNDAPINGLVESLWHEQPIIFRELRGVVRDDSWQPSPQAQADFVAYGLFSDVDRGARGILAESAQDLGAVRVERVYETRGWVIQGEPAISISISSRMIHKEDLKSHLARSPDPKSLVGLWVAAKTSTLKGEIIAVEGRLQKERKRLLALTQDLQLHEMIEKAPDEELIVRVLAGRNQYEYIVSALRIIVRLEDLHRFQIGTNTATKALRLSPGVRNKLVDLISGLLDDKIGRPYSSKIYPHDFLTARELGYEPLLLFGGNKAFPYEEKSVLRILRQHGIFKRSDVFQKDAPIRIGIVNALSAFDVGSFLANLKRELKSLNFNSEFIREEKAGGVSRSDLEKAVDSFENENIHILMAFFPEEFEEDEEGWGKYHNLKSLCLARGIQSQVVYRSTVEKPYAMANIVLGILGKTGNIPYILGNPLPYADIVVGIDIARESKKRLPGSISATAIARIYFTDGQLLRYVIHDAPLEGETIPENVLQRLFPANEFKGKRVVIHRDGYFRGDEKRALNSWAQKIGAQFNLVEIIKTGTPRMYAIQAGVQQPPKGSVFKLSDNEAFLVSSLPPFPDATPQPLRIRTELPFKVEDAVHSVLSLTLLHYGSLRPPRLPVTIHYSDRIAYLAIRGIKPRELEGRIPFWL